VTDLANLDAEVEAVSAARAILRSHAPHTVGTIRMACATLQTLGDGTDWIEAREMLRAIAATKPRYSRDVTLARDVLIGAAVFVWASWLVLVMVMA
jgi:hypothetical protein